VGPIGRRPPDGIERQARPVHGGGLFALVHQPFAVRWEWPLHNFNLTDHGCAGVRPVCTENLI
jgi:hypothetical protein